MPATLQLAAHTPAGPQVAYRYMKENVHAAATESYPQLLDREDSPSGEPVVRPITARGVAAFVRSAHPSSVAADPKEPAMRSARSSLPPPTCKPALPSWVH